MNSSAKIRNTIRISVTNDEYLEAWVYTPEGEGPHPVVILAHGLGAIKAGGLGPFAESFCKEGFMAVAFDYRNWGGSSGKPRDVLSVPRQRKDYETVIRWARTNSQIDASQIFIWGTSFAGMHIVELAASDFQIAGAIAQCPLVDAVAASSATPPSRSLPLFGTALCDLVGSFFGMSPIYIPISVAPGEWGMIDSADALYGKSLIQPQDGSEWKNRIAARSLLSFAMRRPVRRASRIRCPILLVVPEHDKISPMKPALKVAAEAPRGELYRSRGSHYDVYAGGHDHQRVLDAEVSFLRRIANLNPAKIYQETT